MNISIELLNLVKGFRIPNPRTEGRTRINNLHVSFASDEICPTVAKYFMLNGQFARQPLVN